VSSAAPGNAFKFIRTNTLAKNRLLLAAMTNKQSYDDGSISDNEIRWLVMRALGGFGIITTAATHVSKDGQGWKGEFGIFDDSFIDKLLEMTERIHVHNSLIFAQLFHGGMRSPQSLTGVKPISASKVQSNYSIDGYTRRATLVDIKKIIKNFQLAAERCVKAGFDGIEIHGAHGYLISQFLGANTNNRKDEWGGSLRNRSRLLVEIYRSIKESVPDNFLVGVRISPEIEDLGIFLEDSLQLAEILQNEQVDFIHLSCWDIYSRSVKQKNDPRTITEWFTRGIDSLPSIISTGNVWTKSDAVNALHQGADIVGVVRAAIAHYDWAIKIFDNDFEPSTGPYSVEELKSAGLSKNFIEYMRNWKNFVK